MPDFVFGWWEVRNDELGLGLGLEYGFFKPRLGYLCDCMEHKRVFQVVHGCIDDVRYLYVYIRSIISMYWQGHAFLVAKLESREVDSIQLDASVKSRHWRDQ